MILLSILGPTSSGKSEMAVELASNLDQKYGKNSSVIISCDSRQVYKGLNIGTGKIEGVWIDHPIFGDTFSYKNIPHFLIDYIELGCEYNLNKFISDFNKLFSDWKSALPKFVILCGGTGLFAKAIFEEYKLESIDATHQIEYEKHRKELNNLNANKLHHQLNDLGFDYKNKLNLSDQQNPRRLINKILSLTAKKNGWILPAEYTNQQFESKWQFYLEPENIKERIGTRLHTRIQEGLYQETYELIKTGKLDTQKLLSLGLEYEEFYYYYLGMSTEVEYHQGLLKQNLAYLKRQLTWFRKQKNLIKISSLDEILENTKL